MVKKVILYCIVIAVIISIVVNLFPVKWCVYRSVLKNSDREYIVIREHWDSISPYEIIETEDGEYDGEIVGVRLTGNEPSGFDAWVDLGHNTFVCYGEFVGVEDFHGTQYNVYNVSEWDILYPIKRNSLFSFFMPGHFLCRADMSSDNE